MNFSMYLNKMEYILNNLTEQININLIQRIRKVG